MRSLPLLLRLSPAALLAPALIFLGVSWHGADTIAQGLLFSLSFLVMLALGVLAAPRTLLDRAMSSNGLGICAALAFVVLSAATALPLPPLLVDALAHPLPEGLEWVDRSISIAPTSTLLAVLIHLAPLAAFGLGALAGGSDRGRAIAVRAVIVMAIALAALALFDFTSDRARRLDAGLPSSNAAAVLFGSVAILALALMIRTMRRSLAAPSAALTLPRSLAGAYAIIKAPVSAVALLLALLCVLLTGSRGGAIVIALGLAVCLAAIFTSRTWRGAEGRTVRLAICGVIAAVAALSAYAASPLLSRLEAGVSSLVGRGQLAEAHWAVFLESPWLGHGAGSYHAVNLGAMTLENYETLSDAGAAHNIFLQALEEVGIVGVILLALALAQPLWRASKAFVPGASGSEWRAAALGMTVIFMVEGAFDFALQVPAVAAFYFYCLGLLAQPRAQASIIAGDARAVGNA